MERTLDQILADYRMSFADVQHQQAQRKNITESAAYVELEEEKKRIEDAQKALLDTVPDSSEELAMDRDELMKYMAETKQYRAGEFVGKTRVKRKVDTRLVLEAMQGDIDNLMLVANVPIKNIEEFAKANPEYKQDLRHCIIEEGVTVTEIVLSPAE